MSVQTQVGGDRSRPDEYALTVIGAGSAGLTVASVAAQLGVKVALIEAGEMGGDCLNFGCVPSKSLIRCAHAAHAVRSAGRFGVSGAAPVVDYAAVRAYVAGRIAAIAPHDSVERFRSLGCTVIQGRATFVDPSTVSVASDSGPPRMVKSRRFVVATGSSPKIPDVPGLAEAGYWTNQNLFTQEVFPKSLAVLGGGPIGIEMAQAFERLGAKVIVLQSGSRILPRDDEELAGRLAKLLTAEGLDIRTNVKTTAVKAADGRKHLTIETDGRKSEIVVERILVAAGRTPNTDLNLAAAGVEFGSQGVKVDARMQTSARRIYACGDVAGPYLFTHTAGQQAANVIANALFKFPRKISYRAVPWCTFTDPELAHVGVTEKQAREQGLQHRVHYAEFRDLDRAVCESATEGVAKIVVGRRDRVLGAQILGPHAGEIIHEFTLAVSAKLSIAAIRDAVHVYPTYAECARKAASEVYRDRLFSPRTRWLVGLLGRLFG